MRRVVYLVCLWLTALLFIAAGVPKILNPGAFAKAVYNYQILPDQLVNLAALYLPWLEVIAGLALLFARRLRDAAALIMLALLVLFTVSIGFNIFRGINVACGCFSVDPRAARVGWGKVGTNVLFIAAAAVAFFGSRRQLKASPSGR